MLVFSFLVAMRTCDACRLLSLKEEGRVHDGRDDNVDRGFESLLLSNLQKGPVLPPGTGCTYTPRQGGAPCIKTRKVAIRAKGGHPPELPYLDEVPRFGVAAAPSKMNS